MFCILIILDNSINWQSKCTANLGFPWWATSDPVCCWYESSYCKIRCKQSNCDTNTNCDHGKPSVQATCKLSWVGAVVLGKSSNCCEASLKRKKASAHKSIHWYCKLHSLVPKKALQEPLLQRQSHGRHAHRHFLQDWLQMHQEHCQLCHGQMFHQLC